MAIVCFTRRRVVRLRVWIALVTCIASVFLFQRSAVGQDSIRVSIPAGEELVVRLVQPESSDNAFMAFLNSYLALIAVLITALGLAVSNWIVTKQLTGKREEESRQANRERLQQEADRIRRKLDEFYRPFLQLSDTNKALHTALKQNQPDPGDFRLLRSLLIGVAFTGNDHALSREIVEIDRELAQMIATKAGHVDDPEIQAALSKAGMHFRVLILAHESKLVGQSEAFDQYVYPRELDEQLRTMSKALEAKLRELDQGETALPFAPTIDERMVLGVPATEEGDPDGSLAEPDQELR